MPKNDRASEKHTPVSLILAIPARYAATRLPGKPLLQLGDDVVVAQVLKRAQKLAETAKQKFGSQIVESSVLLATDHSKIAEVGNRCGSEVVMTDSSLASGTDRIYSAIQALNQKKKVPDDAIVLNIQGDEPFFPTAACLDLIEKMLSEPNVPMGTLAFKRSDGGLFMKPSVVKVTINRQNKAIAFSRAPIPWPRKLLGASHDVPDLTCLKENRVEFFHHIGVYSFRKWALETFATQLPNSSLEATEGLEQLRAVEAGWQIAVVESAEEPFGIDTPEDLVAAEIKMRTLHES